MCQYCEEERIIIEKSVASLAMLQWCFPSLKSMKDLGGFEYPLGLFIDRGYLRLVDLEDCGCLDHGERIKIKFCPFCGTSQKEKI